MSSCAWGERTRWGYATEDALGILKTDAGTVRVPSEQGAYQDYYTQFAAAWRGEGEYPVPARSILPTLQNLDAARVSDSTNEVVHLA